jgi:hypothetical protein
MSSSRTAYHDGPSESTQRALARIYATAIERYQQTKAAGEDGGENHEREESKNVSRAERILRR